MSRQYEEKMVQALKARQKVEDYHGAPVLVKNLPDSDERGAMDPRLYRDQKKMLKLMGWMPSFLMKMDTSPKGIANLRKMFNGVKSVPCVEAPIQIERRTVPAEDGYEIPVRIYKANREDARKAVLYYIHGGGFFGGSPDVVEESVKMFVAKSGLCAVSVDYRLAPEHPYPRGHRDCYRVLQWIGEQADIFGDGRDHIFVAGDSACVGLPDSFESEGFDRSHMELPAAQNALMEALAAAGTPVAAVLSTGSAVILPWRDKVDSILLMYLAGQNGGEATVSLLFGEANPCGKLAESWPLSLEQNPSFHHFGHGGRVEYRESVFVGYRYYDAAGLPVQYPFGYGLSYTSFAYSDLKLSKSSLSEGEGLDVTLTVTNTGTVSGKEVVQIYVVPPQSKAFRPIRELRAFRKVALDPGESKAVTMNLCFRDFSYYNVKTASWFVPGGTYRVEAAASSRDIRLTAAVAVQGSAGPEPDYRESAPAYYALSGDIPREQFETVLGHLVAPWRPLYPITRNTTVGELRSVPTGKPLVEAVEAGIKQMASGFSGDIGAMMQAMLEDMPLRQLAMMAPEQFGGNKLDVLLAQLNGQD